MSNKDIGLVIVIVHGVKGDQDLIFDGIGHQRQAYAGVGQERFICYGSDLRHDLEQALLGIDCRSDRRNASLDISGRCFHLDFITGFQIIPHIFGDIEGDLHGFLVGNRKGRVSLGGSLILLDIHGFYNAVNGSSHCIQILLILGGFHTGLGSLDLGVICTCSSRRIRRVFGCVNIILESVDLGVQLCDRRLQLCNGRRS